MCRRTTKQEEIGTDSLSTSHLFEPASITGISASVSRAKGLPTGTVRFLKMDFDRIKVVSFEADTVSVHLDLAQPGVEPGEMVIPHGSDSDLSAPATQGKQI